MPALNLESLSLLREWFNWLRGRGDHILPNLVQASTEFVPNSYLKMDNMHTKLEQLEQNIKVGEKIEIDQCIV